LLLVNLECFSNTQQSNRKPKLKTKKSTKIITSLQSLISKPNISISNQQKKTIKREQKPFSTCFPLQAVETQTISNKNLAKIIITRKEKANKLEQDGYKNASSKWCCVESIIGVKFE
jgi:hypothetical protein